MRDHYRIADCDRHVIEPIDMWKEYLSPEFRSHAPYYEYLDRGEPLSERITFTGPEGLIPLPPDLMVDGAPVLQLLSARAVREMAKTASKRRPKLVAAQDPREHLKTMDEDGIDVAALLPTF